ncbi:tabinhibitin 2 [Drosophila gunungcola]|uniref:tabinhibitin 2 n=1 Tax=Drosophila gunungcola TaxID=103775 RepID=UPI0022E86508|nr:tabinhibitin 2 [Drosophila gunungcola]
MQMWYLYLFVLAIQLALSSANHTLCRPDLCINSEVHVGCFHHKELAQKCGKGNLVLHVNGALKFGILDRINTLRNFVASGAGNYAVAARMPTMKWDYTLQKLADRQVRQCDENGKYCANTDSYHYVATTEIRSTMSRYSRLEHEILDKLLPEMFLDVQVLPTNDSACVGHFVPLIQDRGARMGCAIRLKNRSKTKSNVILLCHFSRANVNEQPPYELGTHPGEKCVSGSSQIYKYLCNVEEKVDANSMVVDTKMPLSAKGEKATEGLVEVTVERQ